MAIIPYYDTTNGEKGEDDIPDQVIMDASHEAYRVNRNMAVGYHPDFGWVYRELGDAGEMERLTRVRICDSSGIID